MDKTPFLPTITQSKMGSSLPQTTLLARKNKPEEVTETFLHDISAFLRSIKATTDEISPDLPKYTEDEFVELPEEERRLFYRNLYRHVAESNECKAEIFEFADEALKVCSGKRDTRLPLSAHDDVVALQEEQKSLVSVALRLTAFIDNHKATQGVLASCNVIFVYSAFIGLLIEQIKMVALEQLLLELINHAHLADSNIIHIECRDVINDETQIKIIVTEIISDKLTPIPQAESTNFEHFILKKSSLLQRLEQNQTLEKKEQISQLRSKTLNAAARLTSAEGQAKITANQSDPPTHQYLLTATTDTLRFFTQKSNPSDVLTPDQLAQLDALNTRSLRGIILLVDDVIVNLKLVGRTIKSIIDPLDTSPLAISWSSREPWNTHGLITQVLADWGIIYTGNGSLAYAAIQRCPTIQMMITDHEMPIVTGTQLIHLVRALEYVEKRPRMQIALNTGRNAEELDMSQEFMKILQATFLLKATSADMLRDFIEESITPSRSIK